MMVELIKESGFDINPHIDSASNSVVKGNLLLDYEVYRHFYLVKYEHFFIAGISSGVGGWGVGILQVRFFWFLWC